MIWKLGLNFYTDKCAIFNPIDLDEKELSLIIEDGSYHIYMLCKRKKYYYENCIKNAKSESLITLYCINDKHEKQYLHFKNKDLFISEWKDGYYYIEFKGKDITLRDYLLINNFYFLEDDILGDSISHALPSDLEVMYIGQSFGIEYRLKNHKKIQEMALDILNSGSNEEIIALDFKFNEKDLSTSFLDGINGFEPPTLDSFYKLRDSASERPSESQKVTLCEASLIKYFQPKYNVEYKGTFPSPAYKSYDEIYSMDFNYISIAVDTTPIFARIFSKDRPIRRYVHYHHFLKKTKNEKKTLLESLMDF